MPSSGSNSYSNAEVEALSLELSQARQDMEAMAARIFNLEKALERGSGPNDDLREASLDMVKWLDSGPVQDTFQAMGFISMSHPHLAVSFPADFPAWAGAVLDRFRKAVEGTTATGEQE